MSDHERLPWSDEQREVIAACPDSRLLVEAGPGTGKTAVACARVDWLINEGEILAKNVLLISFTRTAVAEIRNRILAGAVDPLEARSVRISTIDSHAWHLREGFEEEETKLLAGDMSFESNLARLMVLLRERDEQLRYFLGKLEHLIVDEAQDVVGARAELLLELVKALDEACGVTIFADRGQAIYGFADDEAVDGREAKAFLDLLGDSDLSFAHKKLTTIYRTDREEIRNLYTGPRERLLSEACAPAERYKIVYGAVADIGAAVENRTNHADLGERDDALILFRRRAEVLMASSFLSDAGIEHRLRMSGLPMVVHSWIGVLLSEHAHPFLSRADIEERWSATCESPALRSTSADQAWETLTKVARKGDHVDLRRLRELIARPRPPVELCQSEVGTRGPILSTIHASKGREAGLVRLMLTMDERVDSESDVDWDEESRVIYVGATRAQEQFQMGKGFRAMPIKMDSGRVVERRHHGYFFQVGMDGDVAPARHVLGHDARERQKVLRQLAGKTTEAWTSADSARNWRHTLEIEVDDDPFELAELTDHFKNDLWKVAEHAKRGRPPKDFNHVYVFGATTVALPHGQSGHLQPPYNETGIFLAPVVKGYEKKFGKRKK